MIDIALGVTRDFKFTTAVNGVPTQLAGSPVISAYVDNGLTQITAGITLTVDFDGVTGLNNIRVVATSGNGYAAGTMVALVITTGTVGGASVVGHVVAECAIEAAAGLRPTTAGRTLDVSAGGEAGVDWANVGSPTTVVGLSGTTVKTATDVETDTADLQARLPTALGANGHITADVRDYNGVAGTFASGRPEVNTSHLAGGATAATNLRRSAEAIYFGTVSSGTSTTIVDSGLTETDTDHWKGRIVLFLTGALAKQATDITAFTPGTDTLTVTALTNAPSNGDTYVIV